MKRASPGEVPAASLRQNPVTVDAAPEIGPIRIALVAFHFAEYACHLALALARDHPVLLLLDAENAAADLVPALRQQVSAAVEVHFITKRKLWNPLIVLTAARVVRLVERFRPDVLHVQESLHDYGVWPVLWLARHTPLVLTVHDAVEHSGADADWLSRRWRLRFYVDRLRERADRVIVHGERVRAQLLACREWPPERVFSVMLGALGAPTGLTVSEPSGATLLFFGRIESYKGLGVLLDALDLLRDEPAVRLVIAGRGTDLQRFRGRIAVDPRIELIDRFIAAEEIPRLFLRSTIVVLPYLEASQSGVAAIAFNYRRPVIASAVGGLPDVILPGESGILVPPSDPAALAAAIRQVCTDPTLLRRLSAGAEALASGELSWRSIAQRTAAVYRATRAIRRGRTSPL